MTSRRSTSSWPLGFFASSLFLCTLKLILSKVLSLNGCTMFQIQSGLEVRYLVMLDIICLNLQAKNVTKNRYYYQNCYNNFPKVHGFILCHNYSYMMIPFVLYDSRSFVAMYCFICGHWRVPVTKYRLICLVLWSRELSQRYLSKSVVDLL